MLALGVYGMYLTFNALTGWWAFLVFLCSAFCLLFGFHMTRVVGEAVSVWSLITKKSEPEDDCDGKETE